ncbi:MAG: serine hydrolase [Asgard group archaeon]|nr:serine hydrolase [Asgard group archaeon]
MNNERKIDFTIFDNYANTLLQKLKNVGLGISFVSKDKVLYSKGLGLRNIADNLPFTENTLFPLGSHTKSFTATAIALLIHEGLLNWDIPIREYIPKFRVKDQYLTEKMTVRDLLSHTTGYPHHQLMYMSSEWRYDKILERIPYLEFSHEYRTIFKYANINYIIATKIIEELTGENYFDFIKKRFLNPLGMKNTNFSITESFKTDDYTKGYRLTNDGVEEEFYPDIKYLAGGAGSVNSTLIDMGKWIQFHLNKGSIKGKEIISPKTLNELYSTQRMDQNPFTMLSKGEDYVQCYGYAHGFWTLVYRGLKIIQHYGTGPGIIFNGGFMPNDDIGFVLYSNTSGSDIPFILNFHVADQLLDNDPIDWGLLITEFEEMQKQSQQNRKPESKEEKEPTKPPSHPLEAFAGIYKHPAYGSFEFIAEKDKLRAFFGKNSEVEINHSNYNTFIVSITTLGGFGASYNVLFRADFNGEITHLEINAERAIKPVTFEKMK